MMDLMGDGVPGAQTRRPVISRRWSERRALVIAAMGHWFEQNPLAAPDTGPLRGDLLTYLQDKTASRADLLAVLRLRIAALTKEPGATPAQLFEQMGQSLTSGLDEIWQRAAARDEVDPALHPRVRALPFDLVGLELSRTHQPVPRATIEEILDVIVLPLTRTRHQVPAPPGAARG